MDDAFSDTWIAIAGFVNRSERWCRYMARRATDPLPVFKVGGIVRLRHADYAAWIERSAAAGMKPRKSAEAS